MSTLPTADPPTVPRNVTTNLKYWKKPFEGSVTIDFTQPNAEQRFLSLSDLEDGRAVVIRDIRGEESKYTLEKNGFQYVRHGIAGFDGWANDDSQVLKILVPLTEELVRKITGATQTIVYASRIRCLGSGDRAPVHIVHSDFTATGAMQNLRAIIKDPNEFDRLSEGRIIAFNIWRPLREVQRDPLAICDWRSVDVKRDWIPNRFVFPEDGWVEVGKVQHCERHKWFYLCNQTPQEPVIFKQFDNRGSEEGECTLAHSAFVDPEFLDSAPRRSLEIGLYAFFPD